MNSNPNKSSKFENPWTPAREKANLEFLADFDRKIIASARRIALQREPKMVKTESYVEHYVRTTYQLGFLKWHDYRAPTEYGRGGAFTLLETPIDVEVLDTLLQPVYDYWEPWAKSFELDVHNDPETGDPYMTLKVHILESVYKEQSVDFVLSKEEGMYPSDGTVLRNIFDYIESRWCRISIMAA